MDEMKLFVLVWKKKNPHRETTLLRKQQAFSLSFAQSFLLSVSINHSTNRIRGVDVTGDFTSQS